MFEELGNKLDAALKKLRQRGVLTEPMVKEGLREVRRVRLEADVNFKVTRDFLGRVQERALGEQVLKAVSPGQQIVKIIAFVTHNPRPPSALPVPPQAHVCRARSGFQRPRR